jgi:hypothetical protein
MLAKRKTFGAVTKPYTCPHFYFVAASVPEDRMPPTFFQVYHRAKSQRSKM